jgi:AraC-like DNA-binding protein
MVAGDRERAETARESTVSVRLLRGLLTAAARCGVPRDQVLHSLQLSPEQLACADARIARAEWYRLCERMMDMAADPALGFHWGKKLGGSALDPMATLIAHSATLRDGFEALCRFTPLLDDHAGFDLSEVDDWVTVRFRPCAGVSARMQRFCSEVTALGLFHVIRAFDANARLERASFEYAAPSYRLEYTRAFQGAERFAQPFTGIVFDRALMDAVSPNQDEGVRDALRAIAERHLSHTQAAPIALRVRELVVQRRSGFRVDMSTVARALGLSVRSLRRRLTEEGTSYNAVVASALVVVAKRLLVDEQRSIQDAAYEMGFSGSRAFHRAFKAWTGTTPTAFRNAHARSAPIVSAPGPSGGLIGHSTSTPQGKLA